MDIMEMTGWFTGQIFLQTVDPAEVESLSAYLNARNITFQVLTSSEHMTVDSTPGSGVTTDRFSVAIHLAGFPQVMLPALQDLVQRAHGAGWTIEPPA